MANGNKDKEYIVHFIRSLSMMPLMVLLGGLISGVASNWFITGWALTGVGILLLASLLKAYWGEE
jgi:flagellar biosynthesis protein FlhB